MDILPLLDELQTIARNGLAFADNPYDIERYERLLELASSYYAETVDKPALEIQRRFAAEVGYITPKIGANAAVFNADGQILLMLRSDDKKWCLPCGWVEPNESPAETTVREAREECGLDVAVIKLVDVFTRKPGLEHGPHTAVAVVYYCEVIGGELRLSHEGLELKYCWIEDVGEWHGLHERYANAAYAVWQKLQIRVD